MRRDDSDDEEMDQSGFDESLDRLERASLVISSKQKNRDSQGMSAYDDTEEQKAT